MPAAVATSGTAPAQDGVRLAFAPTGPCWVQAIVGGKAVLAGLLDQGDRREIGSTGAVTLRIGDPATCAFSIDGKPARIPGPPGRAVTIRITRETSRQFLTR
jgi:hypothetical protein